jgi:predicted thioredoxin/glutaredoxin
MSTGTNSLAKIQVYSRPGCHLCEILVDQLMPIIRGRLDLQMCNIETNSDWMARFELRIPAVVFEGEEICHFKLDKEAIARIVDGKSSD